MARRRNSGDGADTRTAYDRALAMLARREYSQRELHTRLERAGCAAAESQAAIDALHDHGYQDDRRFGEMLVRTRVAQGYGPTRIRAELKTHALTDAAVRELLDAAGVDWAELALAQLRKKFGARRAVDYAERGKRAAFLLRRGFAAETVRIVTHSEVGGPSV
ncbi:MAG: regulatory protein RecX [Rhodanobacteraceae bacterium]|nr:MAG: regulatory protein RecX [Rhodanobacteraceae bacterium]